MNLTMKIMIGAWCTRFVMQWSPELFRPEAFYARLCGTTWTHTESPVVVRATVGYWWKGRNMRIRR